MICWWKTPTVAKSGSLGWQNEPKKRPGTNNDQTF